VAVSPAPPPPDFFPVLQTGDTLWADCGGSPIGRIPPACSAYVVGASDGVLLGRASSGRAFCLDGGAQADELAEVVRRYLATHPEAHAEPAARIVAVALREAYPCGPGVQRR
jgi:hypothetical protein